MFTLYSSSLPFDDLFSNGLTASFAMDVSKSTTFTRIVEHNEIYSTSLESLLSEFVADSLSSEFIRLMDLQNPDCFLTPTVQNDKVNNILVIIIYDTNIDVLDNIQALSNHMSQSLTNASKIQQQKEWMMTNNMQLLSLIESIQDPTYIIDPETFTILDANSATKKRSDRSLLEGSTCYKTLFHKDEPCLFCSKIHDNAECCAHDWFQYDTDLKQYFHIHDYSYRWHEEKKVYIESIKNITCEFDDQGNNERLIDCSGVTDQVDSTSKPSLLSCEEDSVIDWLNHDLRNSLNPIINLLPVLLKNKTSKNHDKLVAVIENNVSNIKNLVYKSVQLARLRSNDTSFSYSKENLSMVINGLLQEHDDIITENQLHIQKEFLDDGIIRADPTYLPMMVHHLIDNAIKYTPLQGTITISIKRFSDTVHLMISDTGIGMNAEQVQHAFDPFYKADSSRHHLASSGLGLSICKMIMQRYGGSIDIQSQGSEKGTTIHVQFPQDS